MVADNRTTTVAVAVTIADVAAVGAVDGRGTGPESSAPQVAPPQQPRNNSPPPPQQQQQPRGKRGGDGDNDGDRSRGRGGNDRRDRD